MIFRRRSYRNGCGIVCCPGDAGLRVRCVTVTSRRYTFGGLVAIWLLAVSRHMAMSTMPEQVHCDHADDQCYPDPVIADPVHRTLPRVSFVPKRLPSRRRNAYRALI